MTRKQLLSDVKKAIDEVDNLRGQASILAAALEPIDDFIQNCYNRCEEDEVCGKNADEIIEEFADLYGDTSCDIEEVLLDIEIEELAKKMPNRGVFFT